jgi:hypothetical protein
MDKIESPCSDSRNILKRMRAFIDAHRDQGLQMVQGRDYMIFKIDCQKEDGGLTIGVKSLLMETIRSLRSGVRTNDPKCWKG